MLSRAISIILGSSCIGYEGCGGLFCSVAVKRAGHPGIGLTRFWTTGFRYPASCTLIPHSASTPLIQGGSRMRRRARTVLCGGRSAMVVPTATGIRREHATFPTRFGGHLGSTSVGRELDDQLVAFLFWRDWNCVQIGVTLKDEYVL